MKIVVAGGSGFIGQPLVERLIARGHDVAVLTRRPPSVRAGRPVEWDARSRGPWSAEVANADAVVNLAGENIGEGRWTEQRKRQLVDSRLDSTRAIVEALAGGKARNRVLVNASAVGFYGDRGDEVLDERSTKGEGFLSDLSEKWEAMARGAEPHCRLVILRFGVVLSPDGGALQKMMRPFKLGAGGPVGTGSQWMAWIDRIDVIRLIEWGIDRPEASGVYNATAEPVRNRELARALGRAIHRPSFMPAPALALRLLFGQMADETLLVSQRVATGRSEESGFAFESRSVEQALARMFGRERSPRPR